MTLIVKVTFEGIVGSNFRGDLAIDDVSISSGSCPGKTAKNEKMKSFRFSSVISIHNFIPKTLFGIRSPPSSKVFQLILSNRLLDGVSGPRNVISQAIRFLNFQIGL